MKKIVAVILTLFVLQTITSAQVEPIELSGRHAITLEFGGKTNSTTSINTNITGVNLKTGFIGSINYNYWFDDEWALSLSAGMFGAGVRTTYNNVETSAIMHVLIGVKYYPLKLALGSSGRVYTGLSFGQYVGFATRSIRTESIYGSLTETISESVFGGQVSVGADFFVASWFKLGPKLSYNFLGDFNQIIGTKKNLSGAAFSLEIGFVF